MVTDRQVRMLWDWTQREASLSVAAAKAGMDRKTARKYRRSQQLPSQIREQAGERAYRTRPDPFAEVWSEVEALLDQASGWEAKTLFEELQRRYPGRFAGGQLRTLQRRIKQWRARHGPDKEVFFAQEHVPGQLGASDFTHLNELGVTIAGVPFEHMVYHFVLTYSNWEHVSVCFSESFESFSEGFQNAVWALGGAPAQHRSDRMSLAVQASGSSLFTQRYQAVMRHYQVQPQAINAGKGHENGDAEQSHHRFKRALKQALLLRGSRDFPTQQAYARFLHELCAKRNAGRQERLVQEQKHLRPLPARRLEAFRRQKLRVQSGSTIAVERNLYSVPARLIGEWVEARVYADTIEVWYGQRQEEVFPRLRGRSKQRIDYRHVIEWLRRKPGAFAGYRYRASLFPTSRFRRAYDQLAATASATAAREYLGILHLAARRGEAEVDDALRRLLDASTDVSMTAVESLLSDGATSPRRLEVHVEAPDLAAYDELFENKEVWHGERDNQGREAAVDPPVEGTAPADVSGGVRDGGATGPAGGAQL
jgi:Mu transposase, C-terminal domain